MSRILSLPAERKKAEISFFLSIITLPFFLSTKFQTFLGILFLAPLMSVFFAVYKLWLVFNSIFLIIWGQDWTQPKFPVASPDTHPPHSLLVILCLLYFSQFSIKDHVTVFIFKLNAINKCQDIMKCCVSCVLKDKCSISRLFPLGTN